jgi:PTS system galactitol-specific IIC component
MDVLKTAIDTFFQFKAYVMLPLITLLIALIVRMPIRRALLSTIRLAAGFAGIFIAFEFFVDNINPAVVALAEVRGLDLPVLDVGWPPLAAITWASPIAHISIPMIILLNVIMIATNRGRTIYIDIWNYWHFAFVGALLFSLNRSLVPALLATLVIAIYTIKLSEWTAPEVERETGLKGIALSPLSSVGLMPYGVGINRLIELIPGLRSINYNPHKSAEEEKEGEQSMFSEPMVIGVIVGILLGLAAGYGLKDLLELSVHIAAVMFILPKCGSLIGEGMGAVSVQLREKIQHHFPKKTGLSVALDTGVVMHHKSILATGIILMPISLLIALVLPGNKTLPLGDLPSLISQVAVIVLVSRGNVFRSVIAGIPLVVAYLLIASNLAPLITRLSQEVGATFPEGAVITAFTDGGNPVRYWVLELFTGNWIAFSVIPVVGFLYFLSWKNYKKSMNEK